MHRKIHIAVLMMLLFPSCFEENVIFEEEPTSDLQLAPILKFNNKSCSYDAYMEILRYYLPDSSVSEFTPIVEFNNDSEFWFEGEKLNNGEVLQLNRIERNHPYEIEIRTNGKSKKMELVFTNLPIVQIICDQSIYDEPKSLARIQISSSTGNDQFSSFAGIEFRGLFSREAEKKSMGFSLWEGMTREVVYSSSLLGLQKNSDWILGAAFVDPARIRNMVSFKIWNSLQVTNKDHLGIQSKMVEVFINNEFRGLYIFSELLNAELLGVGNEAFLYKGIDWADGATKFKTYNPVLSENQFWNGWEQKIPDRSEIINWSPLNELYEIVVDADDETFKQNISDHLDLDNVIDYYLFLNLTLAIDNTGKNSFLFAANESSPFQYIPWDLDGSWGILYDGSIVGTESILTNNLFERLITTNPDKFKEKMKQRWFYLRENKFSQENIMDVFDFHFRKMNSSDIIQKENRVWSLSLNMQQEQKYINNWTSERLIFLDEYFGGL